MRLTEAIYKLNPTVVTIRGDIAYDAEGNEVVYDIVAAETLVAKNQYKEQRAAEYPSFGDQLDALWKGGADATEMLNKIQAIKAKYPK